MAAFWLLLLFVASAVLVFRTWRAQSFVNKARQAGPRYPPGLEPYPLIGHLPQFLANRHRVLDWMTEALARQTTTCTFVLRRPGGVRGAITANPANVEHFLRTSFDHYPKGPRFASLLHDFLGRGIFNADGEAWRAQRKVASHEFSTRVLRDYSTGVFRDTAAELAGIVAAAAAAAGEKLDMQELLMRSTLDSIFKVGFGVNLGVLSGSSEEGAAFAKAFDDASEQVLRRFLDPFWKAKRFLNFSSEAAMKRSLRTINDFVYAVVDRKIEQMGRDQQEFVSPEDTTSP